VIKLIYGSAIGFWVLPVKRLPQTTNQVGMYAKMAANAVVKSVKRTVDYINQNRQQLLAQPRNCGGENNG